MQLRSLQDLCYAGVWAQHWWDKEASVFGPLPTLPPNVVLLLILPPRSVVCYRQETGARITQFVSDRRVTSLQTRLTPKPVSFSYILCYISV